MIPRSAAVLLFAGLAAAQTYTPPPMVLRPLPARGMMSGLSAGLVFENAPAVVVHKKPGLPAALDTFKSQHIPGVADYTMEAVLEWLGVPDVSQVLPLIEVDAISTGNDLLPIFHAPAAGQEVACFQVAYGSNIWATLSVVREESGVTDIFGCYFDNRSFPEQLRNKVLHEIQYTDLQPAGFDHQGSAITALDFAMGQILANRGYPDPGVIDCVTKLYFSLTNWSAAALQPILNAPIDGSTIFQVDYNGSGDVVGFSSFQPPVPAGVSGTAELDIDALGVAMVTIPAPAPVGALQIHTGMMLLVSYTQQVNGEELFAIAHNQPANLSQGQQVSNATVLPLRSPTRQKLAGPGGLLSGRVKGICGRDPEGYFGTRTFGVPTVDLTSGSDDAVTLPSTHALSVEVATVVANTAAPSGLDRVTLSGAVAGAPQNGCSCILWVLHKGQYRLFPLGVWPTNQTHVSFSVDLDTPWAKPGPGSNVVENEYELIVTMLPGPTSAALPALSNRALVTRRP